MKNTDWNLRYEKQDTPWDKGAPVPALEEIVQDNIIHPGMKVLVPGCGRGHDALLLAQHGCEVVGADISPLALAEARMLANGHSQLLYVEADIFEASILSEKYDAVWEHTCFCAIQPNQRENYVVSMHRLLNKGGLLAGVFFTDTGIPLNEGPPFETSIIELHQYFSDHFKLLWERAPASYYEGREKCEWLMLWEAY